MFQCEDCEKEFETAQALNGHKMGAHSRKREDNRKERIPVGVRRQRLGAEVPEGKVGRWVNDRAGRLQRFLDGGYEFEKDPNAADSDDSGTRISKIVSQKTGMKAYLMTIDKELYDEDQAMKQERVDNIDNRIRNGTIDNKLGEHGYTAGIKYEPKKI